MRMLMNNLDPEVAERPDDLVVYGGTGRAARSWAAFDAIVATLRTLEGDETMLVQSGKPVGVFRTHEWAPRVLIANSNLVPDWATWEEFRRLEALGLTMYGQMTAGLVDLHRHAGHPAGHLRVLRRDRPPPVRGIAARHDHADRRARRHGRRAAARDHDERRGRAVRRGRRRTASSAGSRPATSTRWRPRSTTRSERCHDAKAAGRALSIGVLGNAADVVPKLLDMGFDADIVTDQTSAHDPLSYVPNDLSPEAAVELRTHDPDEYVRALARRRWPRTARRWSASSTPAPRCSTTATASGPRRRLGGFERAFDYPGFLPAYIRPLFCEGKGPFRWVALSGDPADIAATDRAVREELPDDADLARWLDLAERAGRVPGTARAHLLARLRRAGPASGCASTRWCAPARCRRRSSSAATTSTRDRSRRRIARPRRWPTAATRSPTGRC